MFYSFGGSELEENGGSRMTSINLSPFGCGDALLSVIERLGNSRVELVMNRDQWRYIRTNMERTADGSMKRKTPRVRSVAHLLSFLTLEHARYPQDILASTVNHLRQLLGVGDRHSTRVNAVEGALRIELKELP